MAISYEKYKDEYQRLWDTMKIIRDAPELSRVSQKISKHQIVYQNVEKATGVPWQMIAVIHLREAGEGDIGVWKGVLHNGQKIVGTGRKTTIVPIGRGPFDTWRDAAIDALKLKGFDKIKDWPVSRMLWALEPYNGYGYRNKGLRTPYLWASTNHQQPGKYVADHVFDPNVMDRQIGTAALLKFLGVGKSNITGPVVIGATITGVASAAWTFWDYALYIGLGGAAAVLAGWLVVKWYNNRKAANVARN